MHRFPHGIRQAILQACGGSLCSCLPLLTLLSRRGQNSAENEALLSIQQVAHDGGDEGYYPESQLLDADNQDLQPHLQGGQDKHNAEINLQSLQGAKGYITPVPSVDEKLELAVNRDLLQPIFEGPLNKKPAPLNGQKQVDGISSPKFHQKREDIGMLTPRIGVAWAAQVSKVLGNDGMIYVWLMQSSRPRVKMKGNMMLNDVHAWKHDAWAFSSSSSTSFIDILSLDVDHSKLPQVLLPCLYLPFTLLRGRKGYQAQERQFQVKRMVHTGSKTKPMRRRTTMRLSYLKKDLLDPG